MDVVLRSLVTYKFNFPLYCLTWDPNPHISCNSLVTTAIGISWTVNGPKIFFKKIKKKLSWNNIELPLYRKTPMFTLTQMNHNPQKGTHTGAPQAGVKSLACPKSWQWQEEMDVCCRRSWKGACLVFFSLRSKARADVQGTWTFIPRGLIMFLLLVFNFTRYDVKRLFIIWETNPLQGAACIFYNLSLNCHSLMSIENNCRKGKDLGETGRKLCI